MDGGLQHPLLERNQRSLVSTVGAARRAHLLIARAEVLARLGAGAEAVDVLRSAAALVAALRGEDAAADREAAAIGIELQRTQATIDYFDGRVPESIATLRAAIDCAGDAGLALARAQCLATLSLHLLGDGRDFDAIEPALEALRIAGARDATTRYRALLALAKLALAHGLQDLAAPLFAEMLVAARALDDPLAEAAAFERMTIAHCESARVAYLRGSLQDDVLDHSIAAARENIALSDRAGGGGMQAVNQCRLAQLLALRGEHRAALALLEQAVPRLQPVASVRLSALADLAATLLDGGRADEAFARAREVVAAVDDRLPPLCRAYVLMRCADVLARAGTNESGRCVAAARAGLRQFDDHRRRVRERLQAPLSEPVLRAQLGPPEQFGALGQCHESRRGMLEN